LQLLAVLFFFAGLSPCICAPQPDTSTSATRPDIDAESFAHVTLLCVAAHREAALSGLPVRTVLWQFVVKARATDNIDGIRVAKATHRYCHTG
jgi:hypothetical protein